MSKRTRKTKVIKFIDVLQKLLTQNEFKDIIKWDDSGLKIKILDKGLLQENVLPHYFKHGNYSSFLRQLNMYGFTSCKDQNGILTYEHPFFNKKKVQMKNIQKKQQQTIEKQPISGYCIEQEELRNTIITLKQEQIKIQQKLISFIQFQHKFTNCLKSILNQIIHNKEIQERRGQYFIGGTRMIVNAMKPEAQNSFNFLIKTIFPKEELLENGQINQNNKDLQESYEFDPQFFTSPAIFGKQVIEDIGNYLNHKQDDFNVENLEPVWYFGQQESDLNFFGFEL